MKKNNPNAYESAIEGYKLFFLLRQTAEAIHKLRENELRKFDITPQQALALVCIYSLGNTATPAELSRWLYREPNSITILLNRMQKLGLIKKRADSKRKNVIRLSLTNKGYEAYKQSIEFQTFYTIINILPERKRKQLYSLLTTIREEVFNCLHLEINSPPNSMDNAIFEPDGKINIRSNQEL